MAATLRSRLPEITAEIPLKVGAAIHEGTNAIAQDASERASSQYGGEDPAFNIQAGTSGGKYGILASWYWFFGEFGTSHQPARPYMIPAVEAGKDDLVAKVRAALERL